MLVHSWPKLVIEWRNSDIGWTLNWYRIHLAGLKASVSRGEIG
jgi:hypothetical protein